MMRMTTKSTKTKGFFFILIFFLVVSATTGTPQEVEWTPVCMIYIVLHKYFTKVFSSSISCITTSPYKCYKTAECFAKHVLVLCIYVEYRCHS